MLAVLFACAIAAPLSQQLSNATQPSFSLDASTATGTVIKDTAAGIEFASLNGAGKPTPCPVSTAGGVKHWDLRDVTLSRSGGGSFTEGAEYTHAFWLQWTPKRGFRTLFHHSEQNPANPAHLGDHCQFTQQDLLGVRSNRAPAHGTPEFNCLPTYSVSEAAEWRFVVAVGTGTNATSPTGSTAFYVGGKAAPKLMGKAARTCCGMSYDRVGWPGKDPCSCCSLIP